MLTLSTRSTCLRGYRFRYILVTTVLAALFTPLIAYADDPIYDQSGSQYGRGFFAPLPFERIDTVTGNVFLSFTDLVLPGNAGMNLSIVRTYNSRDGRWRFGIGGAPLSCLYAAPNFTADDVECVTADGAKHRAAAGGAVALTQEFWRFTPSTSVLEMPNGIVATYGHVVTGVGAYLTEIRDPFNNVITLSWQSGTSVLQSVTQELGYGQSRTVTFTGWSDEMADDMVYAGRHWHYGWATVGGVKSLVNVEPPVFEWWGFTYALDSNGAPKLDHIETPNGGRVDYTWATETFPTTPAQRIAVKTRTTGGTAPYGVWTFDWTNNGATFVITGPSNRATYGLTVVEGVPVGSSKTVETLGGTVLETETLTYTSVPGALGDVPVLASAVRTLDGRTFATTYSYSSSNYADYGQPSQIVEAGELSRTTTLTYQHSFGAYILGRVASTTVVVGGSTRTATTTYDGTTGFVLATTVQGVPTTYVAGAFGNLASTTDATNRSVSYQYDWGVVSQVAGGGVTTTRVINSDGTVASETTAGMTISYQYDLVGRVTQTSDNTPGRVPVVVSFILSGNGRLLAKRLTSGSTWVQTDIDGFGRTYHTVDSAGVESRVTYNAVGQATYRSRPFGPGVAETGTTYTYDALGRPTGTYRASDGSSVETAYNGRTVSVTESLNSGSSRVTQLTYEAFGSPSDARLDAVRDATNAVWGYIYDGAGHLTGVNSPGEYASPARTWSYDAQGFLTSATQPESGQTTYGYDAVGRLTSMTDARGVTVTSSYDTGGRLVLTDAPGTAEDVVTTYDSAGRVATVANGTVQSTLTYDNASRVTARTGVIAGRSFAHTFEYDGYDHLVTATYPVSGRRVFYDYDGQQRLTGVRTQLGTSGPIQTLATNFTYRGDGSLASYQYGNGQTFSVTQDARNRPGHLINGPLDVTYAYDHVGNVTSITDTRPGFTSQFGYDLLDRLTSVTGYGARSYTYNPEGDRLTEASTTGTINFNYNGQRQLSSLSGAASGSFTYDATGSLLTDPSGITYTYSALGAQQSSTIGGQTTTYAYAGGGSRSVKTGPDGVPHLFVHGAGGGPIAEYKLVGTDLIGVREYVYLGGTLLASMTPSAVTAPPMSVSITTPTPGSVPSWQWVTLTAAVTVAPGLTIQRVEYYNNGLYVGQASSGTFAVPWLAVAFYPTNTFIARLVLTDGRAVSSAPVTVTIQ